MKNSDLFILISYMYLSQAITMPWAAWFAGMVFMIFSFICKYNEKE